jgi:hypothetical protein
MRLLVLNTDIRILVIAPPIIGFGGFFVWLLVMEVLTKGSTSQASFEIGLGLACLVECIAGCAEIYKQEMPGAFGKIVRGKIAVGSGLLIVTIFGLAGIYILGSGLIKLFSS